MKRAFYLLLALAVLQSCRKDPSSSAGTNSLVYEADEYIDIMTNFAGLVNTASLNVENVNPYEDIMGSVIASASESTIDGEGVAISNIEISNVRVSRIELYSGYDIDMLFDYLETCSVVMKYFDASGNIASVTLGTMSMVSPSQNKVLFTPSSADLTSVMKESPDKISFELQFNGFPTSEIDVKYTVAFDYSYSYDTEKVK